MTPLIRADLDSACWVKLGDIMHARLATLRAKVENPRLTEGERLELCWRISEIKRFLDLGNLDQKRETDAG